MFTTSTRVKNALMIPAGITQHDTLIGNLVDAVDRTILQGLRLDGMTSAVYEDKFDIEAWGQDAVLLRRRPVVSVGAVTDNGSAVASADYYFEPYGKLRLKGLSAQFTAGKQMVSVSYNAGFASPNLPPEDIALFATTACALWFNCIPNAGLGNSDVGGHKQEFTGVMPDAVERLMASYRQVLPWT